LAHATDTPQLDELIELFYQQPAELANFQRCTAADCPSIYRQLLDHNEHMTVTVEQRHGEMVDVEVLRDSIQGNFYLREILLRKTSDRRVVQYGIVRLRLDSISGQVQQEILAKHTPLGRVLIEHDVLRQVQLAALWQVECGLPLAGWFNVPPGTVTFGRTAMIYLDGEPAIELLEVVAPEVG
jgi:chorismate-pyruvate lyase